MTLIPFFKGRQEKTVNVNNLPQSKGLFPISNVIEVILTTEIAIEPLKGKEQTMSLSISQSAQRTLPEAIVPQAVQQKKQNIAYDYSQINAKSLFIKVYSIACARIQLSLSCRTENISLLGRVVLFTSGLLLLIPVINTLVYLFLHLFCRSKANEIKEVQTLLPQPQVFLPQEIETETSIDQETSEAPSKEALSRRRMSVSDLLIKKKQLLDCALKERSLPPLTAADTLEWVEGEVEGMFVSKYGDLKIFSDPEILEVFPVAKETKIHEYLNRSLYARHTEDGKTLIQQQNRRGSFPACVAMMMMDQGKTPDFAKLKLKKNPVNPLIDFEKAKVPAVMNQIAKNNAPKERVQELRELIEKDGPAIINILDPSKLSQAIIVDSISEKAAKIRCPYHWWQISISLNALEKAFQGGNVIQVKEDEEQSN
jgi:hypothetical protein